MLMATGVALVAYWALTEYRHQNHPVVVVEDPYSQAALSIVKAMKSEPACRWLAVEGVDQPSRELPRYIWQLRCSDEQCALQYRGTEDILYDKPESLARSVCIIAIEKRE